MEGKGTVKALKGKEGIEEMEEQRLRSDFDIASISKVGQDKPVYHVQEADRMDPKKVASTGQFIKVFADVFLRKEAGDSWIF